MWGVNGTSVEDEDDNDNNDNDNDNNKKKKILFSPTVEGGGVMILQYNSVVPGSTIQDSTLLVFC